MLTFLRLVLVLLRNGQVKSAQQDMENIEKAATNSIDSTSEFKKNVLVEWKLISLFQTSQDQKVKILIGL